MTAPPEFTPAPAPAYASSVARRIIAAANLVPAGRWVSYGDLAEAIGSAPRGVASALSAVTPLRMASDAADDTRHWVVP
jgi:O6-methylguanine-DNA--protein-cysteine methyltransferase